MDPHPRCLGPGGGVPTQGLGGGPTSGPSSGLGLSLPGKRESVLTPQPPEVSRPSQDTGWQSLSCPVPRVVRAPAQLPPQPSPLLSCCRPDSRHPRRASPMGAADPGCQPAWLGRGTDGRRVLFLSFQDLGRRSLELTGSLVGADCACPCCLSGPAQPPENPAAHQPSLLHLAGAHRQPESQAGSGAGAAHAGGPRDSATHDDDRVS